MVQCHLKIYTLVTCYYVTPNNTLQNQYMAKTMLMSFSTITNINMHMWNATKLQNAFLLQVESWKYL